MSRLEQDICNHDKHYWSTVAHLKAKKKNAFDLADLLGEGSTVGHRIWERYDKPYSTVVDEGLLRAEAHEKAITARYEPLREALVDTDCRLRDFLELIATRCSDVEDGKLTQLQFYGVIESAMQDVYITHVNGVHFATIKGALALLDRGGSSADAR